MNMVADHYNTVLKKEQGIIIVISLIIQTRRGRLHHFVQKKFKRNKIKMLTHDTWHLTPDTWHVTRDTWHVTCDMSHVTCDMWHMTCDTWHVTHGGEWTFSLNVSSLALTVWERQCLEDSERKNQRINQSINQSMNYEGVYRTASATPGLLIIFGVACKLHIKEFFRGALLF